MLRPLRDDEASRVRRASDRQNTPLEPRYGHEEIGMESAERHRRLLLVEQGVNAFVINVVLNGLIAWLLLRNETILPLWGDGGIGPDLLITAFIMPFAICLIVSTILTRQIASGKLPGLPAVRVPASGLHRRPLILRSVLLGLAGVLGAALPIVALLDLAGANGIDAQHYVIWKALWAGLLALFVSPPTAWWALAAAASAPAAPPSAKHA
jgi:hypothetical protein